MNTGFDLHFHKRPARTFRAQSGELSPPAFCEVFTNDVWEEYALGMRSQNDCMHLEEHLLLCHACQDRLAKADEYIRVAKTATRLSGSRKRLSKPAAAAETLTTQS
jgi:hypothetical protein